jgi:hypothetical protein
LSRDSGFQAARCCTASAAHRYPTGARKAGHPGPRSAAADVPGAYIFFGRCPGGGPRSVQAHLRYAP